MFLDLSFTIVFPLVIAALCTSILISADKTYHYTNCFIYAAYIVQPIRFIIAEEIGCSQPIYSYIGYIIVYLPALLFSLISIAYCRTSYHPLPRKLYT